MKEMCERQRKYNLFGLKKDVQSQATYGSCTRVNFEVIVQQTAIWSVKEGADTGAMTLFKRHG